jgi:hypothetical protein
VIHELAPRRPVTESTYRSTSGPELTTTSPFQPADRTDRTIKVRLRNEESFVVDRDCELGKRPRGGTTDRAGSVDWVEHRLVTRAYELAEHVGRAIVDSEQTD